MKTLDLWLDETSDEVPRWVVDLDGNTLATFAERSDAYTYAKDCCQRMGYPVVEIDRHGIRDTLYEIDRAVTMED